MHLIFLLSLFRLIFMYKRGVLGLLEKHSGGENGRMFKRFLKTILHVEGMLC